MFLLLLLFAHCTRCQGAIDNERQQSDDLLQLRQEDSSDPFEFAYWIDESWADGNGKDSAEDSNRSQASTRSHRGSLVL